MKESYLHSLLNTHNQLFTITAANMERLFRVNIPHF